MEISNTGANNRIFVPPSVSGRIIVTGDDNSIRIAPERGSGNVHIELSGNNASLEIDEECMLGHLFIYQQSDTTVKVGKRVGFNGMVRLLLHEPASISIGDDSLISGGVDITVSDTHGIFDLATRARINPAQSVSLGEHCWIGQNSLILKGVQVGDGSIVGAASVLTHDVPPNSIAAGVPAKTVREGVFWSLSFTL